MFINPASDNKNPESEKIKNKKVNKKKSSSAGKSEESSDDFFDILLTKDYELTEKELKKLIDMIFGFGNSFVRSPTEWNLKRYKSAIKEYLQKIEKKLYKIKEELGMDVDYPRLHVIAEVIDEKIGQITQAVFKKEKDTLFYASRIGEVNGLLVDLYR
ncbi:MAG TPA: YaaR family protein [Petrotogaceae bacterium]|jgi:hypothetical protein|nr:YaaR family protein [Petrotogaceae bacterium]HPO27308.1 YaaR family protein [Petrotogaceae bacterium]